jgi:hypothetical protein
MCAAPAGPLSLAKVSFHAIEYAAPSFVTLAVNTPPAPAGAFGFGTSAPAVRTVRYVKTSAVLEAAATPHAASAAAALAAMASLIIRPPEIGSSIRGYARSGSADLPPPVVLSVRGLSSRRGE